MATARANALREATMRVLVVHNRYRQAGGEDIVVERESQLLAGHGVTVEHYLRDNTDIGDTPGISLALQTLWSPRTLRDVSALIRDFAPHLIHVHNTFPLVSPSLHRAAARHGVPVVQTVHNFRLFCLQAMFLRNDRICEDCVGHLPWNGVLHRCYRNSLAGSATVAAMVALHRALRTYDRHVTRFVAPSAFCRNKLVEAGMAPEKLSVKPHFVDASPRVTGPRKGGLFVGRLSREKGTHVLSKAAAEAAVNITVVGGGPEAANLGRSANLDLQGSGDWQAIMARMQQSAYLVMPSICYETFGLPVVEAYACGLPVIASRHGALAELVQDGRTGLLFEPGNASDLAQKLTWAEAHPVEMARMGASARAEYESNYTAEDNYERLMAIYNKALNADPQRQAIQQ
jgi:glycosyltransferase involved in cell wall biosynthesis